MSLALLKLVMTTIIHHENTEEEKRTTGKRNSFESSVAYILPKDPVEKRHNKPNRSNWHHISDTSAQYQGFGSKVGIGKTGVKFIYH